MLSPSEKASCLTLAREAIRSEWFPASQKVLQSLQVQGIPTFKAACFVTLTQNGTLRGCIGTLWPYRSLAEDVHGNARAAAFEDPRFSSLRPSEEPQTAIEISLLSTPQLWSGTSQELLAQQVQKPQGVIFRCEGRQATFLPQVWEQLSGERFFSELSRKAGCSPQAWHQSTAQFWTYQVEAFADPAETFLNRP